MRETMSHLLRGSPTTIAAAALLAGCAGDAPLSPIGGADAAQFAKAPALGACQNLQVPASSKRVFHVYAEGDQIYQWDGTSWVFLGPEAELFADAGGHGVVGIHYAGPTWESNSGSKVVAAVVDRCTPDPAAIPWLLLGAVSSEGPGIFHRVSLIQRLNTVGGNAPAAPGNLTGEVMRAPYTAEYFFYRD